MQLGKHDSEQVRQHGVRATQILPSHSISTPISQIPDRKARWRVFVHAGILIFTFEFTKSIRALPLVSQYQNDLCSSATEDTPCQSAPSIAGELEKVLAIFQVLDCLPVLLLSGFYGSMADRYGKGSILILSYLGVVLSSIWITGVSWLAPTVPLRLIWLGPLFSTIGGGHSMPISLLMTSIADVVPRAQRAATYSFVYGAAMVATTLGTKSALAMLPSTGTFAPLLIGLDLMWLILALSVCMPNTRRENAPVALVPDWYSAVDGTLDHLSPTICKQQARGCKSVIQAAFDSNHALWHTQGAFSILLAGFISALGQQLQVLVLQYMPERFSVDSTDHKMLISIDYIVNLMTLFLLLPWASTLLLNRLGYIASSKDLLLARISATASLFGVLVMSTNMDAPVLTIGTVMFGTGIALNSLLQSIFVESLPPEHATFATALMSAAISLGSDLSGPLYSFAIVMIAGARDMSQNMPFFVSGACFATVLIVIVGRGK